MSFSNELKRCVRCLLPETHETISFDEKGVCNICRQQEYKKQSIDWDKAKLRLDRIVEDHRDKFDYDCIMPFSGGKDSTWALYWSGCRRACGSGCWGCLSGAGY